MNIFPLDHDPMLSGVWMDDSRLTPCIEDTCSVLCSVVKLKPTEVEIAGTKSYKTFDLDEPWVTWANRSAFNFRWLLAYLESLIMTKGIIPNTKRYHRSYLLLPELKDFFFTQKGSAFKTKNLTTFVSPSSFSSLTLPQRRLEVTLQYRIVMFNYWKVENPTWTNGIKPIFAGYHD